MLRLSVDYDPEFTDLYNKFNASDRRKDFLHLSGISRNDLDFCTMSKEFFTMETPDMSVDPNANIGRNKSFNTYTNEIFKGAMRLNGYYLLWNGLKKEFSLEVANKLTSETITGLYYPHDLTKWTIPYCIGVSTYNMMTQGRPFGDLHSKPPKRTDSYISQVIETTMDLSQNFAGAIAVADLIPNYTWYLCKELAEEQGIKDITKSLKTNKKLRKKITNELQRFVHTVNNKFRVGGDSPFTNVSVFDRPTLSRIFNNYYFPDGTSVSDILEEIIEVQYLFMKFMADKDPLTGTPYRFPITTCNIFTNGPEMDQDFINMVSETNTEGPFNIFITSDNAKIASCCRLINNVSDLMKYKGIDSFGNGGLNIGSHRVCTVNLVRVAKESKDLEDFKLKLSDVIHGAVQILVSHRNALKKKIEAGFLQFFNPLNWFNLDQMFYSTVGLSGFYEALLSLGYNLLEVQDEPIDVLKHINNLIYEFADKYSIPINVEQTPAEGAAVNLAKKDAIYFGENEYQIYANQFIPLWVDVDLWTRGKVDGMFSNYFPGGMMTHLNIGCEATKEQMEQLLSFAIKCGLEHFALNPVYSICSKSHSSFGKSSKCPECGEHIIDHVTRVVGYFTPVSGWAKVRREYEFPKRNFTRSL